MPFQNDPGRASSPRAGYSRASPRLSSRRATSHSARLGRLSHRKSNYYRFDRGGFLCSKAIKKQAMIRYIHNGFIYRYFNSAKERLHEVWIRAGVH